MVGDHEAGSSASAMLPVLSRVWLDGPSLRRGRGTKPVAMAKAKPNQWLEFPIGFAAMGAISAISVFNN